MSVLLHLAKNVENAISPNAIRFYHLRRGDFTVDFNFTVSKFWCCIDYLQILELQKYSSGLPGIPVIIYLV